MTSDPKKWRLSTRKIISSVYKEIGISGLFRGASLRVLYFSLGGFAYFGIYEMIKIKLDSE